MAVPGSTSPRSGLHRPHVRVWPSGHSGSTRSTTVEARGHQCPHVVADRAVVLDVRRPGPACRARRRRGGRSTTGRRRGPRGPGRRGRHQRIGWVTEKTHRPPGRSTRATSCMIRAGSAHERHGAVRGEGVGRRLRRRTGARCASAWTTGTGCRCARRLAGPRPACPPDRSSADRRRRPAVPATASTGAAAAADLEDPAPPEVLGGPSRRASGLAQVLGAPHEAGVAQELAVLVPVLGGVVVPPAPGGPGRVGPAEGRPGHRRRDRRGGGLTLYRSRPYPGRRAPGLRDLRPSRLRFSYVPAGHPRVPPDHTSLSRRSHDTCPFGAPIPP